MDELKINALAGLFFFVFGIALCYAWLDMSDKPMPPAFTVEQGGKIVGFAETDPETSEIVSLSGNGVKSPGIFIAFPIFMERDT